MHAYMQEKGRYMCMYAHEYVYIDTYKYACLCRKRTSAYAHIHKYAYMHTYIHVHTCVHVCVRRYLQVCMHMQEKVQYMSTPCDVAAEADPISQDEGMHVFVCVHMR